ncbi:12621_t:CDS:2, partial [Dentiscutata heterogama]
NQSLIDTHIFEDNFEENNNTEIIQDRLDFSHIGSSNFLPFNIGTKKGSNMAGKNRSWTELTIQELKI